MKSNKRKTPIMGWASWNCFRTDINEKRMKEQIDALVSTGLSDYGYDYINMDDGFFGGRDENGVLKIHAERFPNGVKVIADYAHKKGLKAGIYSDAGDNTCGFYYDGEGKNGEKVGLYGYEKRDLEMYLEEWGFDFIKVDWCGGVRLGLDEEEQYGKIGKIIDEIRERTGRTIVYNICRWQFPGAWAAQVADSWRTGADIVPNFKSVIHQIDNIKGLRKYCGPGHINDLDMMQLGNGMSEEEERTHFAMWCMMSTPLMIGCDLTRISDSTLNILKNKELIEINQDSACLQAYAVKDFTDNSGELLGEIWIKDLGKKSSSKKAVAFLNRSDAPLDMELKLSEAGLTGEIISVRDVCLHEDMPRENKIARRINPRGAAVFVIESENAVEVPDKYEEDISPAEEMRKITADEAKELAQNGGYLVDVREKHEYARAHLAGAINIPYMDIHAIAEDFIKDKSAPVAVYCSTGKRSSQSYTSLKYLGYENLYYLGGVDLSKIK
ncbi:MAG: alpha-galactosidase [Firmicutes bacterium]|nr:alpha-galactosidase [Bacillota bacterium]